MGVGTQSTLEDRACNVSDTGWMAEISSVSHLRESQTHTKSVKSTEPVPRGSEISNDLLELKGFLVQFSLKATKMIEQDKSTHASGKRKCLSHAFPFFW